MKGSFIFIKDNKCVSYRIRIDSLCNFIYANVTTNAIHIPCMSQQKIHNTGRTLKV